MSVVLGVPAIITSMVQDRTLERMFHDSLYPLNLFRGEAKPEEWPANLGENQTFTRAGIISPNLNALTPGVDPVPGTYNMEQWEVNAAQYGGTLDTHMPTSSVTMAPMFLRNTQQLGLVAAMTLNRLTRAKLLNAYESGQTVCTPAGVGPTNTITLKSLNGFTRALSNGRYLPISGANPLTVTMDAVGGAVTRTVTAYVPTIAGDELGGGTVTLSGGAVTWLDRAYFTAANKPYIQLVGGGTSIDAITSTDILTLQDVIDSVALLRNANVPTFPDGYYHVHLDPRGEAELFKDAAFRQLNTSLPDYIHYRELAIGTLLGCVFYRNVEMPKAETVDLTVDPVTGKARDPYVGELTTGAGLSVYRAFVFGAGTIYEKYIPEERYISEAGVTGKVGEFSIVNNSLQVMTDRIRYIIRSPLDRLQQVVSQSWSWSGDFAIPTDGVTGNAGKFKRGVVIIHA